MDLGIPEGQTVDKYRGGEGMLKRVLEDVRKYAFTGYVKLVFEPNADRGEGIILFNSGEPLISIYTFKKAGASHAERYYKGGKAVEFIWEDSLLPDATISLHSRVPVSDYVADVNWHIVGTGDFNHDGLNDVALTIESISAEDYLNIYLQQEDGHPVSLKFGPIGL